MPRQSSRIRSTQGRREVNRIPIPPQPYICKLTNQTHMFPSHDSIVTASSATTITENYFYYNQIPIDIV